jgi:hypothetical protein
MSVDRFINTHELYMDNEVNPLLQCARGYLVRTERLADTETILYRLGSKFNRNRSHYCENPIIRSAKTRGIFVLPEFCCD